MADQVETRGVAAGLGGGGPAGARAEVVHALLDGGRGGLGLGVRRAADEDLLAENRTGGGNGKVALTEVQDVGADGVGHVGTVVDREELAVPGAGVGEDFQVVQLLGRLHALVAQLHDVDATGQHGVQELREVALLLTRVGAEIEPGVGELGAGGACGGGVGHAEPPVIGLPGG